MWEAGAARKEEEEGEEKKERRRLLSFSLSLPADVAATRIRLLSAADVDRERRLG